MKSVGLAQLKLGKIILIDIAILTTLYFVPTLSHLTSIPLYLFEPMRIMVLMGLLLGTNKTNAYFLALTLPIFSFFMSGHPVFPKNILIATELMTNVFLFVLLSQKLQYWKKRYSIFISMFLSIFLSKIIYYGLKYLFIYFGMLGMGLISTGIGIQITIMLTLSLLFSLFGAQNKPTI